MYGVVSTIIGAMLSGFLGNLLLNILNNNMCSIFNSIGRDLDKLINKTSKGKLLY